MATPHNLPFTVEEYRTRLGHVQKEIRARGVDVLMVTHLENIYYLTGYRTIGFYSFMALFVQPSGDPTHFGRFIEKSSLQGSAWIDDLELHQDTEAYIDACTRTRACILQVYCENNRRSHDRIWLIYAHCQT